MTFDIVYFTEEELKKLTLIQMQLLRTAQKKKNELYYRLQKNLELFKRRVMGNDTKQSNLYADKEKEMFNDYNYEVDILREQLIYSLEINEPYPPQEGDESAGYIVDYSLSYVDRYAIVRAYYLAIEDPVERMRLYTNDDVARRYLGSYYSTLYNVLYTYSQ